MTFLTTHACLLEQCTTNRNGDTFYAHLLQVTSSCAICGQSEGHSERNEESGSMGHEASLRSHDISDVY